MNTDEVLELYDQEERIELTSPEFEKVVSTDRRIVRHVVHQREGRTPRRHFIAHSNLSDQDLDEVIKGELDYFKDVPGSGLEWPVHHHDEPPHLGEALVKHGFKQEDTETIMACDLSEKPEFAAPMSAQVRRLKTASDIETIIELQEVVWGKIGVWLLPLLAERVEQNDDDWSFYSVEQDGKAICCAWVYFNPRGSFASLFGGTTLPDYRNRGAYLTLLNARANEAVVRGYKYLLVNTSEMSKAVVSSRGFKKIGVAVPYFYSFDDQKR